MSFKSSNPWPKSLDSLAHQIGVDPDITQGPGGNVSYKDPNGVLWVKASGTHMKDALIRPIFVGVDLEEARNNILNSKEIFVPRYGDLNTGARASIETAMHAQIEAPIVAHVHSMAAMALAVQRNPADALRTSSDIAKIISIPYAKPGLELSSLISQHYDEKADGLLLGNHGLTVWGSDWHTCLQLILALEEEWKIRLSEIPSQSSKWIEILSEGILIPDQVVFLGPNPFKKLLSANSAFDLLSDFAIQSIELSPWIADMVKVLEKIVKLIDEPKNVNYLTPREIDSLLNWDAEKYRMTKND